MAEERDAGDAVRNASLMVWYLKHQSIMNGCCEAKLFEWFGQGRRRHGPVTQSDSESLVMRGCK